MADELVQRLRAHPSDENGPSYLGMIRERCEAADAIESLRREVEALKKNEKGWIDQQIRDMEERDSLHEKLAALRKRFEDAPVCNAYNAFYFLRQPIPEPWEAFRRKRVHLVLADEPTPP